MNNLIRITLGALLLAAAGCSSRGAGNTSAPVPQQRTGTEPVTRATGAVQTGDTVYVIRHYVRPERRSQFEDFVQTVLWQAFRQSAAAQPAKREAFRGVRLLKPLQPEEDGVLTYAFLLDPYVAGESYNVLELLQKAYPDEEARRQYSRFTETWARDFTTHAFVQSRGQAVQ